MSPPRVTFQIGQTKTGTSAIQAACAANRTLLAEREKILYPSVAPNFLGPGPASHQLVFRTGGVGFRSPEEVQAYFSEAFKFCEARDLRHVVISWEAFLEEGWVDQLRQVFDALAVEPDFIVYLRRQDTWVESAWKQWRNKLPGDPGVAEYALNADVDWHTPLTRWRESFPTARLQVRPYEKGQLQGSLMEDFFAALGCDQSLASQLAKPPDNNFSRNSGFRPDVMAMLTMLRDFNRDKHDVRLLDLFGNLLDERYRKREFESYSLLSPAERIQILQKAEPSNQRIAREFLGRADGRLFLEPWPDAGEPWQSPESLTWERALPILINLSLGLHERTENQGNVLTSLQERTFAHGNALQELRTRAEQEVATQTRSISADALEEVTRPMRERLAAQAAELQTLRENVAAQGKALQELQALSEVQEDSLQKLREITAAQRSVLQTLRERSVAQRNALLELQERPAAKARKASRPAAEQAPERSGDVHDSK